MSISHSFMLDLFRCDSKFLFDDISSEVFFSSIDKKHDAFIFGKESFLVDSFLNYSLSRMPFHRIDLDFSIVSNENDFLFELYNSISKLFPNDCFKPIVSDLFSFKDYSLSENIHNLLYSLQASVKSHDLIRNIFITIRNLHSISGLNTCEINSAFSNFSKANDNICFIFSALSYSSKPSNWLGALNEIEVCSIEINSLLNKCETLFEISFREEVFSFLYHALNSSTLSVFRVCSYLSSINKNTPSRKDCVSAIIELVSLHSEDFKSIFSNYSSRQKIALKAAAFSGKSKVFNSSVLERFDIVRQALGQGISSMEMKGELVKISPGCYVFSNTLFGIWLNPLWSKDSFLLVDGLA